LDLEWDFTKEDDFIDTRDEPDHQELCNIAQSYFIKAIQGDIDLTEHLKDAVNSLRIVLVADESFRTHKTVTLSEQKF